MKSFAAKLIDKKNKGEFKKPSTNLVFRIEAIKLIDSNLAATTHAFASFHTMDIEEATVEEEAEDGE
jgi:hypothetical protein